MHIKILDTAINDLYEGRLFYDTLDPNLGEYFYDSLFADIDSLVLYAGIHEKHYGFYRLLSKRFPYAIYYTKDDKTILVFRVLDLRKNPSLIKNELRQ